MSRISETEFYNDKDVITQIEWLKNNIKADHIDHIQVEQIADKGSEDYGQTTVKITMENGHEYEGKFTSAILKDVRIQSGEDFNVMVFELANGETISANIPTGSDSYWALIKGEPQSNTALKAWMDEKAEAVDLTNETNLRVRSDEALGQRITNLDRDIAGEIDRIDGELADKAEKSALEEETTKRTEADTGLLQAITEEETARQNADEELGTAITGKADQSALETEIAARTDSDTGLLQAITAEETARKSADDGIYGRITELNKDLDDEITARTEADALKEDKSNKVSAWQATPDDTHYPSEKLVKDALITEENTRRENIQTLLELIKNNKYIIGTTQVDYTLLDDGIEQIRVILASSATVATITKATVLYIINVNKYLENYNYQAYRVSPSVAPFNQEVLPASILPKNFTSYNGAKCVFLKESGQWHIKREDGQNLGTDRFTFTFIFKTESKKV